MNKYQSILRMGIRKGSRGKKVKILKAIKKITKKNKGNTIPIH